MKVYQLLATLALLSISSGYAQRTIKKVLEPFLCLYLIWPATIDAQDIRTSYYKGMWESASERKYEIKRIITRTDSGFQITDYRKGDKLKFQGEYSAIDPDLPHGHFVFYNEKGILEAEGNYTHGELSGNWTFYNMDGSLKREVSYDLVNPDCDSLTGHGNALPFTPADSNLLEVMPVFPGGSTDAYYTFLYDRLVYPPLPAMYYKTGRVIGKFTIDATGKVCEVYTEGGVDKDMAKETTRVMLLLPRWEPARKGNIPVPVKFTIPIKFNFR